MTTMRWATVALAAPLMFANATGSKAQVGISLSSPPPTFNSSTTLTLPQELEVPVSPITPGTAPGTLFNQTAQTNPFTGRPCTVEGSLAIGNSGTLPGTAPVPGTATPTQQLQSPISVFGSATGPGPC